MMGLLYDRRLLGHKWTGASGEVKLRDGVATGHSTQWDGVEKYHYSWDHRGTDDAMIDGHWTNHNVDSGPLKHTPPPSWQWRRVAAEADRLRQSAVSLETLAKDRSTGAISLLHSLDGLSRVNANLRAQLASVNTLGRTAKVMSAARALEAAELATRAARAASEESIRFNRYTAEVAARTARQSAEVAARSARSAAEVAERTAREAAEAATKAARIALETAAKTARAAAEAAAKAARAAAEVAAKAARAAAETAIRLARIAAELTAKAAVASAKATVAFGEAVLEAIFGGK